ncbi:hypothetical protein A3860_20975 [Niastella vici]|uniref:Uncharacterized protein n=1 Tax=Niastella vici TaxID=1703345 RepID=A0A1V9G1L2_9BACT|nr:hypothetical protein A3860_20975 [Niastella vici]
MLNGALFQTIQVYLYSIACISLFIVNQTQHAHKPRPRIRFMKPAFPDYELNIKLANPGD